jgi:hypothetical protein
LVKSLKWLAASILGLAVIFLLFSIRDVFSQGLTGTRDVEAEGQSADVDFPVAVAVKGGMLEVVQVAGRRSIPKSTDPVILGQSFSYCREEASWTVPYRITYRLNLGERWTLRYRNGALYARVPELEPALPVAFDTGGTQKGAKESCWFVPDLGTRERAFKAISPELAKFANSKAAKDFAREQARVTVVSFLRTWAFNQTDYPDVAPDTQIRVIFPGE